MNLSFSVSYSKKKQTSCLDQLEAKDRNAPLT
jgi:hypothetical protein